MPRCTAFALWKACTEQTWVFTYQTKIAHFFNSGLNLTGSKKPYSWCTSLQSRNESGLWHPMFLLSFFQRVRSCCNSVGADQSPSVQTAHLSVPWTPSYCQVSALSQFPIHTLYCAAQYICIVEVKEVFFCILCTYCVSLFHRATVEVIPKMKVLKISRLQNWNSIHILQLFFPLGICPSYQEMLIRLLYTTALQIKQ